MSHSVSCYIRATSEIDNPTLTVVKMQTDDVGSQYTLYRCTENGKNYIEIIQGHQTIAAPATEEMIERCFVERQTDAVTNELLDGTPEGARQERSEGTSSSDNA